MAGDPDSNFDHTRYREEVIERWGEEAYERSDKWYRSLSAAQKEQFQQEQLEIASGFARAKAAGETPEGERAQELAGRQYAWITTAWQGREPSAEAFRGLGQMYVDDHRFAANYDRHGEGTTRFIRDAMVVYAKRNLE